MELRKEIENYFVGLREVMANLDIAAMEQVIRVLLEAREKGKQIITMGNGGHGATASHWVNDLGKHTIVSEERDRVVSGGKRFRTVCLNDNMSTLTAWANDLGFENCFSEQIANWVGEGEVVIGVSGSGNSENILRAFQVAKEKGATTICLTGRDGGRAKEIADICFIVPSQTMIHIEDVHLAFTHMCSEMLRRIIAEEGG